MKSLPLIALIALGGFACNRMLAQPVPRLLPFQARLTDATGQPLADGARVVQFQIFGEPTGAAPLWAGEVHRASINGGLVNVMLGSKNPLPNDRPDDPSRSFFDAALFLQVTPDANADDKITEADPPLLPRQAIVPVLFAQEAAVSRTVAQGGITAPMIADGAVISQNLAEGAVGVSQLATDSVTLDKLADEVLQRLAPVGTILAFGGEATPAPPGWLLCDGQCLKSGDYPALFSAIGKAWGDGSDDPDPATDFNLPDLRGYFLRGRDLGSGKDPDAAARTAIRPGGNTQDRVGSVQTDEIIAHKHTRPNDIYDAGAGRAAFIGSYYGFAWATPPNTGSTGGNETRPKNAYVNYIIKY
ncbi:MAG TPA: tail fiber protein [Verrucomicrobiota bacterium]|nr:tail fiber protein [Verrucomicrobiota bacterium]HNU50624.1 tail fiber protein [Verrucomicrobiota bacterium]